MTISLIASCHRSVFGPSIRKVVTLSARAACCWFVARASLASASRCAGYAASPCAVRLRGEWLPVLRGSFHSLLARPTGTVSFSRDSGECLNVTRRPVAVGGEDFERVVLAVEPVWPFLPEDEEEGAWN